MGKDELEAEARRFVKADLAYLQSSYPATARRLKAQRKFRCQARKLIFKADTSKSYPAVDTVPCNMLPVACKICEDDKCKDLSYRHVQKVREASEDLSSNSTFQDLNTTLTEKKEKLKEMQSSANEAKQKCKEKTEKEKADKKEKAEKEKADKKEKAEKEKAAKIRRRRTQIPTLRRRRRRRSAPIRRRRRRRRTELGSSTSHTESFDFDDCSKLLAENEKVTAFEGSIAKLTQEFDEEKAYHSEVAAKLKAAEEVFDDTYKRIAGMVV